MTSALRIASLSLCTLVLASCSYIPFVGEDAPFFASESGEGPEPDGPRRRPMFNQPGMMSPPGDRSQRVPVNAPPRMTPSANTAMPMPMPPQRMPGAPAMPPGPPPGIDMSGLPPMPKGMPPLTPDEIRTLMPPEMQPASSMPAGSTAMAPPPGPGVSMTPPPAGLPPAGLDIPPALAQQGSPRWREKEETSFWDRLFGGSDNGNTPQSRKPAVKGGATPPAPQGLEVPRASMAALPGTAPPQPVAPIHVAPATDTLPPVSDAPAMPMEAMEGHQEKPAPSSSAESTAASAAAPPAFLTAPEPPTAPSGPSRDALNAIAEQYGSPGMTATDTSPPSPVEPAPAPQTAAPLLQPAMPPSQEYAPEPSSTTVKQAPQTLGAFPEQAPYTPPAHPVDVGSLPPVQTAPASQGSELWQASAGQPQLREPFESRRYREMPDSRYSQRNVRYRYGTVGPAH